MLLRIVLGEPKPLREWRSLASALSSELIRVEALHSIDRARILLQLDAAEVAERRAGVQQLLAGFRLARVDERVLARAAEPFPTLLRTLDAIHLATAVLARAAVKTWCSRLTIASWRRQRRHLDFASSGLDAASAVDHGLPAPAAPRGWPRSGVSEARPS